MTVDSDDATSRGPRAAAWTVGRGPRQVEARLLERLDELAAEAKSNPAELGRAVLVVVPSTSLAGHLGAAWLSRRGRAFAGVAIETLWALARRALLEAGEPMPTGGLVFEVLVRRRARAERALAAALGGFADGYGALAGTVRDLLDAGFERAHLEACLERVAALSGAFPQPTLERARALLRVAADTGEELAALGLGRTGEAYARAASLLRSRPELLPARAILLHGWADATGLALDLLETLVVARRAEVLLDLPGPRAGGLAFADRLALRLTGRPASELALEPDGEAAAVSLHPCATPGAEARRAVVAARALLDAGAVPERIALVARDVGSHRLALAEAFGRLGVPFSAPGTAASPGGPERRMAAFLELLRSGTATPVDRWLEAAGEGRSTELRLALRILGASRLADLSRLDPGSVLVAGQVPLPIAASIEEGEDEEGAGSGRQRRGLPGPELRAALARAKRAATALDGWPGREGGPRPLSAHLRHARTFLVEALGWLPESPPARPWQVLAVLEAELPGELPLAPEELFLLAERAEERLDAPSLGGAGSGVQLLSVTEARGRVFEHLFLLGAQAGSFPRSVREDPFLPDDLRRALTLLLPDLPVKGLGVEEESYLFGQLLGSAPAVEVSWAVADEAGQPLPASPFVDRLRWSGAVPNSAGTLRHPSGDGDWPALEWLIGAGLAGDRRAWDSALPPALALAGRREPPRLRRAVLDELDPDLGSPEGRERARRLGPWFGLLGRGSLPEVLPVTAIEAVAACPWQSFLGRELRLGALPDPRSGLPELSPRLVGMVVHALLARLVARAGGAVEVELAEALVRSPVSVPLPPAGEIAAELEREAERVAREDGVPLLTPALAERAAVFWNVLREGLGPQPAVMGAELRGEAMTGAEGLRVGFRADLLLPLAGEPTLLDLKAGRPFLDERGSDPPASANSRKRLPVLVAQGRWLQGVAYASALSDGPGGGYLFLGRPELNWQPEERLLRLQPDELEALRPAFTKSAGTVVAALARGSRVPRLLDPALEKQGPRCRSCTVKEACLQEDSGARRRFTRWAEAAGETEGPGPAAARALFWLGRVEEGGGE
ncbi:MAG TPA: PD-(D/E)XK nuclease family protein [Thermoanaerobaculia bacterium]|nr:PD-(D/E)XK nuclease family protein [Thermoanaerobaculia bacterium]